MPTTLLEMKKNYTSHDCGKLTSAIWSQDEQSIIFHIVLTSAISLTLLKRLRGLPCEMMRKEELGKRGHRLGSTFPADSKRSKPVTKTVLFVAIKVAHHDSLLLYPLRSLCRLFQATTLYIMSYKNHIWSANATYQKENKYRKLVPLRWLSVLNNGQMLCWLHSIQFSGVMPGKNLALSI